MKTVVLTLLSAVSVATAVPALAHDDDYGRPTSDWNYNNRDGEFGDDIAHVREGIQHGLSDGSYNRWQAARFGRELGGIEQQIWASNEDGRFNPWERQMINRRLERLHAVMHAAHDSNHEQEEGYYGSGGYGGYSGGWYQGPR